MSGVGATQERPAPGDAQRRSRVWVRAAVVAVAALFVAVLAYGLLTKAEDSTIDDTLARGDAAPAPGFELPVLERGEAGPELTAVMSRAAADSTVSLDELRGTPVVLNFWASWCEPCRDEARALEEGWDRARGRRTLFLGLNMQDLTGDAMGFLADLGASYPSVRDGSNATALDWGVTGLPETFFVSAGGEVVGHVVGAVSPAQLETGVRAAEQGRPVGSVEGGDRRSVR